MLTRLYCFTFQNCRNKWPLQHNPGVVNSNAKQLSMHEASLLWDRRSEGECGPVSHRHFEKGREEERQIPREPQGGALHQNKACEGLIRKPVKSFWRFWAGKAWPQICTRCYGHPKNNDKNSNDNKHKQDQAEAVVSYCLPHEDDPKASRKLGGTWPEHLKLPQSEGPILRPVSGTTSPGLPTVAPAGLVLLDNLAAKVIYFSSFF